MNDGPYKAQTKLGSSYKTTQDDCNKVRNKLMVINLAASKGTDHSVLIFANDAEICLTSLLLSIPPAHGHRHFEKQQQLPQLQPTTEERSRGPGGDELQLGHDAWSGGDSDCSTYVRQLRSIVAVVEAKRRQLCLLSRALWLAFHCFGI